MIHARRRRGKLFDGFPFFNQRDRILAGQAILPIRLEAVVHVVLRIVADSADQISTESASHKRLLVLLVIPMEAAGG
jgi:hypothetical protein